MTFNQQASDGTSAAEYYCHITLYNRARYMALYSTCNKSYFTSSIANDLSLRYFSLEAAFNNGNLLRHRPMPCQFSEYSFLYKYKTKSSCVRRMDFIVSILA